MNDDEKKPPPMAAGDGALASEERPEPIDPTLPQEADTLRVRWKVMGDNYAVLTTDDGKAAGWVSRSVGFDGREQYQWGVGGAKGTAKSAPFARSAVVRKLARACTKVGMSLFVKGVGREDHG